MLNWLLAIVVASQTAGTIPAEVAVKRKWQPSAIVRKLEALTMRLQGYWLGTRIKKGMTIEEVRRIFDEADQPLISGDLTGSSVFGRWYYVEYGLSISFDNRSGDLTVQSIRIQPLWK